MNMNKILSQFLSDKYQNYWEFHAHSTAEQRAANDKIDAEMKYFSSKLYAEDYKRLESFESLHDDILENTNIGTFNYAFRLSALFMCAVFMGEGRSNEHG